MREGRCCAICMRPTSFSTAYGVIASPSKLRHVCSKECWEEYRKLFYKGGNKK